MKVEGLQLDIAWEDPAENFARVRAAVSSSDAELIVLPEMFATGFDMRSELASSHAPSIRAFLSQLAREKGIHVLAGLAEPSAGLPRNAAVLFDPQGGEVGRYHKLHPFTLAGEHQHYDAGETLPTFEVRGLRVTPLICYDLRFPEPFRAAATSTDLFVVVANWPAVRREAWRALLTARAIENLAFVLGVNRVGEGDGLTYAGDSTLVSPLGEVRAACSGVQALVGGAVDQREVAAARARFPFLDDRRGALYPQLRRS